MSESATVYIWYPNDGHIGHASMFIGNATMNMSYESMLHPFMSCKAANFNPNIVEEITDFMGASYVSWWPEGSTKFDTKLSRRKLTLQQDENAEGCKPHAVYRLLGLDVAKMWSVWKDTIEKQDSHYKLVRKNCSTMVLRIMKAGGVMQKMSPHKRLWFTNNAFVTPKNIAQICNDLRDGGFALKEKAAHAPTKDETPMLLRALGMR